MARYIITIVLLAVIAGPVFAQQKQKAPDNPLVEVEQQRRKEAERVDRQYNATMKNTDKTVAPVRTDPWQNMRGANDPNAKR